MKKPRPLFLTLMLMLTLAFPAGASYTVQPDYPDNQRPDRQGHFNLHVKPGHAQTLEVEIENKGTHAIVVEVTANAAVSNENGVMEYAPNVQSDQQGNELLPDFSQIVRPQMPLIPIEPGMRETAVFDLIMPDESFAGSIVGGLHFVESLDMRLEQMQSEDNATGATGIINRMAYVIAVVLREDAEIMPPAFALSKANLDDAYSDALRVTLKNQSARISSLNNFTVQLYDKPGESFPLETLFLPNVQLAPYAEPSLRLWRDSREPIAPGTYQVMVSFDCEGSLYIFETPLIV